MIRRVIRFIALGGMVLLAGMGQSVQAAAPEVINLESEISGFEDAVKNFFVQVGDADSNDIQTGPYTFIIVNNDNPTLLPNENINYQGSPFLESYMIQVQAEPASNQYGTVTIQFKIKDPNNEESPVYLMNITFEPVNDAPQIQDNQIFSLDENSASGTEVGQIIASDPDTGTQLSYSITGGTGASLFSVNATTGMITVTVGAVLDYEISSSYTLAIDVTDQDEFPLTDSATLQINLNDINEPPSITDQSFSVNENSAHQTLVGTVAASDPEDGAGLVYTITDGSGAQSFDLNSATGDITVAEGAVLDFETLTEYILNVKVQDKAEEPLSAQASITIKVNDVDDPPTINLDPDNSKGSSPGFTATFTEGQEPLWIADRDASISDVDSPTLDSLTVTITNVKADDQLAADPSGTSITGAYVNGVLTLTGTDAIENFQQVLRTVTFGNTSENPDSTERMVSFVVKKGTVSSPLVNTVITIYPINDPPQAEDNLTLTAYPGIAIAGKLVGSDIDGDPLNFSIEAQGQKGLVEIINIAEGHYSYKAYPEATGTDQFTFKVSDSNLSDMSTVTIDIKPLCEIQSWDINGDKVMTLADIIYGLQVMSGIRPE